MAFVRSQPAVETWSFDRAALVALGREHARAYQDAAPYPHVVIDGLLGEARSEALARAIPDPSQPGWKRRDYAEQVRLGRGAGLDGLPPELRGLLDELAGAAFLDFLGALTGRRDLIADPHYTGAGLIVSPPGGHLALHVDFNRDSARKLDRVVSALYYVPRVWDDAWGGELELWDRARTRCEVRIAPRRDRLVIVAFGEDHWHGHPAPLRCPEGELRVVIAAHYFAARAGQGDDAGAHGAIWGGP